MSHGLFYAGLLLGYLSGLWLAEKFKSLSILTALSGLLSTYSTQLLPSIVTFSSYFYTEGRLDMVGRFRAFSPLSSLLKLSWLHCCVCGITRFCSREMILVSFAKKFLFIRLNWFSYFLFVDKSRCFEKMLPLAEIFVCWICFDYGLDMFILEPISPRWPNISYLFD